MNKENEKAPKIYRVGKLTILQIMSGLAVLGLVLTWGLHFVCTF